MKKMLVILADYDPFPSSNSNCLNPLLNIMEVRGWHIDLITRRTKIDQKSEEKASSSRTVYRVPDYKFMNTILYNQIKQIPTAGFLRLVNRAFSFVSKSLFWIYYRRGKKESFASGWDVEQVVNVCRDLHRKKAYDVILSVSFPSITHEIAMSLKQKEEFQNTKWILFEFDPFCYNVSNYGKNAFKKYASYQHRLFQHCDKIFCTPQLKAFYKTTDFSRYVDKMISIDYANIAPISVDLSNVNQIPIMQDKITCIYCGVLKKDIRNPSYLFKVFEKLPDYIKLLILTGSNTKCYEKDLKKLHGKVTIKPHQNLDTAHYYMSRADFLINIGNTVVYQMPGKLFEYMSLGKPIIHVSKIEKDPCLDYLSKYPLAFVIEEYKNDPGYYANKLIEFCEEFKDKRLSYKDVQKYVPLFRDNYGSEQFYNAVEDVIENG